KGDDSIDVFLTARCHFRYPNTINSLRNSQTLGNQATIKDADDLVLHTDSDCDELNTAKVALMANLSHYGSDVIAKRLNITSDSNIILYSQYMIESQQAVV
ncbi:hypothetical protein Tco_1147608, partial [Tanacetum coccineum]